MEGDPALISNLILVLILVLLNGLFVAAEFSILNSHPLRLKERLGEKRKARGGAAIWLISKMDLSLTATQLGISTVSLLLGWLGVSFLNSLLVSLFTYTEIPASLFAIHALAGVIAVVALVFLHIVIGEIVAKALGSRFPEQTLQVLSKIVLPFAQGVRPIAFLVTAAANALLRLFGTSVPSRSDRYHSVSELSLLVSQSTERGVLDKDEEKMLRGVFGFSDTIAREVMTPRTDLVSIPANATFGEVVRIVVETGFSRFPVRGDEIDDIRGLLLLKDLLSYVAKAPTPAQDFSPSKLMREAYFIPGTKPIDDLLNEFKHRKLHMAIVLDEHGGVDGVVTLEDLIEEIVGDIFDESDIQEQAIVVQSNGDVIVDAGTLVADFNERFRLSLPEGDYDTIAGFIFSCLGRLARVGDEIVIGLRGPICPNSDEANGFAKERPEGNGKVGADEEQQVEEDRPVAIITVECVDNNRIEKIRLHTVAREEIESQNNDLTSEDKGLAEEGNQ